MNLGPIVFAHYHIRQDHTYMSASNLPSEPHDCRPGSVLLLRGRSLDNVGYIPSKDVLLPTVTPRRRW